MKILITVADSEIAPRFDLTTEVVIGVSDGGALRDEPRTLLLPGSNAQALCDLIVRERIDALICGAIEENYYHFLTWKKIKVFDFIIGAHAEALRLLVECGLEPGTVLSSVRD